MVQYIKITDNNRIIIIYIFNYYIKKLRLVMICYSEAPVQP